MVDKRHGRVEIRTITTTTSLVHQVRWPGVKQICRIVRERTRRSQFEVETAYYVSSLPRARPDAANRKTNDALCC